MKSREGEKQIMESREGEKRIIEAVKVSRQQATKLEDYD